ncbi:MAG TPA: exopolysaccharide biosynthesis protein [Candidatus Limnocylindrales bacterium]|nr:exopolysaccharide biosynthesis protein [Candidatus Limnocylindrales bacterium]
MDDLLSGCSKRAVTLGQLIDGIDERSLGLFFVLLALPLFIPLPPGIGAPFGILLLIWSVQRLIGIQTPWCPGFLRKKVFSEQLATIIRRKGLPIVRKFEKLGRNV